MTNEIVEQAKIAIFRGKQVRKTIHNNEWWFVINDIIFALTDSSNSGQYLKNMRSRDESFGELFTKGGGQIEPPLALEFQTAGGKQKLLCWNTEAIFRMIQSIPSPKAEPFKRWLARVGYERIQEIEDPELAQKRSRALYKAKGYPDDWIQRRMRSIAIREELTNEWKQSGVQHPKEYEILTAEISQAAFGIKPSMHKKLKGLSRQNLRDHMTDLELLFSMLGEAATTEITKTERPLGFEKSKQVSRRGGKIAGDAREKLEKETGRKVISKSNYLPNAKKLGGK